MQIGVIAVASIAGLVACASPERAPPASGRASPPPTLTATPPPTVAVSSTAAQRSRAFLQRQIDAALRRDRAALVDTFSDDAIVLVPLASEPGEVTHFGIGDGFHGMKTTKASIATLIAGGSADAVWFYADVATENEFVDHAGIRNTVAQTTRVVELVSAAHGWRAVAASFTEARGPQPSGANPEIAGATDSDGTLAMLATDGAVASMAPDGLLVGPEAGQLATGPAAARTAITAWRLESLTRIPRPREIRTSSWGFVQGHLDQPRPDRLVNRLAFQLFCVPRRDGSWQVVLAQYLAK